MTIKEIIQKLNTTITDPRGQESHFESWLTLIEGIIDAIDALKALDKQEPVAFASHGVLNWIADKQFQHEADLYTNPPQRKPLTDKQIEEIADGYLVDYRIPAGCAWNFARDIEAAHGIKEKNNECK